MSREETDTSARITVQAGKCKGCGLCVAFCPKGLLELADHFNRSGYHPAQVREDADRSVCTGCGFCARMCPDTAITVSRRAGR